MSCSLRLPAPSPSAVRRAQRLRPSRRALARRARMAGAMSDEQYERALGYPFDLQDTSFLFLAGRAWPFDTRSWKGALELDAALQRPDGSGRVSVRDALAGAGMDPQAIAAEPRTPVLAIGSNASPSALARKYAPALYEGPDVIPVVQSVLDDFDSVFGPCIAGYGSVTATLERCPGARLQLAVTYLTAPQLQRMHETEGGYHLLRLSRVRLRVGATLSPEDASGGVMLNEVLQYNVQQGALHAPVGNERSPLALAALRCEGRRFPALAQREAQVVAMLLAAGDTDAAGAYVRAGPEERARMVPEGRVRAWVAGNLADPEGRKHVVQALRAWARPLDFEGAEVLASLAGVADPGAQAQVVPSRGP